MGREEFDQLSRDFVALFEEERGMSYARYSRENCEDAPKLKTLEDALFFVLFQAKNDLIFGSLGAVFTMTQSTAHKNLDRFSDLLARTLAKKKVMPVREFDSPERFDEVFADEDELLIDGTEQPIQRAKDDARQREAYSGKKKRHTDVNLVISTPDRYLRYVSYSYVGKENDMGVLLSEFDVRHDWFAGHTGVVDLGFTGLGNHYEFAELVIGKKRPYKKKGQPRRELSEADKSLNRAVSKRRIYVEHAIGGMKRYRYMLNKCRTRLYSLKNKLVGICAGLWNYHLTYGST